jgi:hypothetical protein
MFLPEYRTNRARAARLGEIRGKWPIEQDLRGASTRERRPAGDSVGRSGPALDGHAALRSENPLKRELPRLTVSAGEAARGHPNRGSGGALAQLKKKSRATSSPRSVRSEPKLSPSEPRAAWSPGLCPKRKSARRSLASSGPGCVGLSKAMAAATPWAPRRRIGVVHAMLHRS